MRRIRTMERGTVMVELALLLPLLVLIVMLVLEGSRLVRTHQVLNNAAREGARLSVNQENFGNTADIASEVVTYAAQNGVAINTDNVTVNQAATIPTPSGISMSASMVTVNYTYTMNYLSVFAWLGVPSSFPLQGSAEFRNFYNTN
jgi:Flp pilus assembly protein TadG